MIPNHKSRQINTINYMADFLDDWKFLGFMPLMKEYNYWGAVIDGVFVCAVHVSKHPIEHRFGDDPNKEDIMIDKGLLYVVCFYGPDNTSYCKRFKKYEHAIEWIMKTKEFNYTIPSVFFYNS